jgi:uncharacterized protein YndB with AHSA1/START domain
MSDVVHDTFTLERRYPNGPEAVFAALSDPARKARWYAAGHHGGDSFEMDFRVGGEEASRYTMDEKTPFPGTVLASDSRFLDIVPGQRVVMAQLMTLGERRISAALITFEIAADGRGARLTLTHQAAFFEGSGGPEMRKDGWEQLLSGLDKLMAEA